MAFVLPMIGYGIYRILRKHLSDPLAAAIGGYVGINAAALAAAVEFGLQPLLFTNELGQALYCPYPLSISIPAMMAGHLTFFGLAEAIFTGGLVLYMSKAKAGQQIGTNAGKSPISALYAILIAMIVLCPLGLLAEGTAWGEWAPEEIAEHNSPSVEESVLQRAVMAAIMEISCMARMRWQAYLSSTLPQPLPRAT